MPERTDAELFEQFAEQALAAGRADVAGECLRRAALGSGRSQESAEQLHAVAIQYLNQSKLTEAETLLSRAIRLQPQQADWHDHLAVSLARQKRLAEAEATFALAIRLNPKLNVTRRNHIQCLLDLRRLSDAEKSLRAAVENEPQAMDLQLLLGQVLGELKRHLEAVELLKSLSESHSKEPQVWNRLGVAYGNAEQLSEAETCFREQIRLDPEGSSGYANLAAALGKQKKWLDAVEAGQQAVKRQPNDAQGWANLGNAQRDLGWLEDAVKSLTEALRLDQNSADAAGNLALTIAMMARPADALPWYDYSLKLKNDAAEVHFNRAVSYLWLGDYARGWPEYEWRWLTDQMKSLPRRFAAPYWDGSSLAGKTILIHAEQGHGDTVQFCRLVPQLLRQGAKVLLSSPPILADVLRTLSPEVQVVTQADQVGHYDCHCPLMSLPYRLNLRLDQIPNQPYLRASTVRSEVWKDRLKETKAPRIGLVWQGNPGHIGDRFRSIPLKLLEPLLQLRHISWISVQKGPGAEQLQQLNLHQVQPLGESLTDFNDTTGLLANLDLLISVDTATVHLMGAIGRPVWVLLPVNNDWRWLLKRSDSPWYPTARLFRQKKFGDWTSVMQEVRDAVRQSYPE